MSYFKYTFEVMVNGEVVVSKENKSPTKYEKILVFVGDRWYPPLDGVIKNLLIFSGKTNKAHTGKNQIDKTKIIRNIATLGSIFDSRLH